MQIICRVAQSVDRQSNYQIWSGHLLFTKLSEHMFDSRHHNKCSVLGKLLASISGTSEHITLTGTDRAVVPSVIIILKITRDIEKFVPVNVLLLHASRSCLTTTNPISFNPSEFHADLFHPLAESRLFIYLFHFPAQTVFCSFALMLL